MGFWPAYGISILLFSSFLFNEVRAQQYIPFAQHVFNASSINPAYAGYKEDWNAQVGIRSQWNSLKGAPRSGYASIDGVLDSEFKRHGAGAVIAYDKIGVQSATSLFVNYALRLQIDEEDTQRLSLGVAGGWSQYSLNGKDLVYIDEEDPVVPQGIITTFRPDVRLGVFYHTMYWYVGVAVHDLFANADSREDFIFNQNSLEGLYRNTHGYLMLGAALPLGIGLILRPNILVKDDFIGPTAIDASALFVFDNKLSAGLALRTRSKIFDRLYEEVSLSKFSYYKSLGLLTQLQTTSKLKIGYSYEYSLNKIAGMNSGTHELSLVIPMFKSKKFAKQNAKYF